MSVINLSYLFLKQGASIRIGDNEYQYDEVTAWHYSDYPACEEPSIASAVTLYDDDGFVALDINEDGTIFGLSRLTETGCESIDYPDDLRIRIYYKHTDYNKEGYSCGM